MTQTRPAQHARAPHAVVTPTVASLADQHDTAPDQRLRHAHQKAASGHAQTGIPTTQERGHHGKKHDDRGKVPQRRGLAATERVVREGTAGAQRAAHVARAEHAETDGHGAQLNRGAGQMTRRLTAGHEQADRATQPTRRKPDSLAA